MSSPRPDYQLTVGDSMHQLITTRCWNEVIIVASHDKHRHRELVHPVEGVLVFVARRTPVFDSPELYHETLDVLERRQPTLCCKLVELAFAQAFEVSISSGLALVIIAKERHRVGKLPLRFSGALLQTQEAVQVDLSARPEVLSRDGPRRVGTYQDQASHAPGLRERRHLAGHASDREAEEIDEVQRQSV